MFSNQNTINQIIFRGKAMISAAALILIVAPIGLQAQATQGPRPELLGEPVPANETGRLIRILPTTRFVNVTGGELVRFEINGKFFSWSFNGALDISSFVLNRVMPVGLLDHHVTVYIAPNPNYNGPY